MNSRAVFDEYFLTCHTDSQPITAMITVCRAGSRVPDVQRHDHNLCPRIRDRLENALPRPIIDFYRAMHYSAERGLAIACRPYVRLSVCPSVTLVDQDHIGWKVWKLITRTISLTLSLFVAQRPPTYSHGNMGKFFGD